MATIFNAASQPLFYKTGTLPDVSGALQDLFQPITFTPVSKIVNGFQVVETGAPINFRGVIQQFSARALLLKPEGQRAWSWAMIHADPTLVLEVDDVVVTPNGMQMRIMTRLNYTRYGYVEYHAIEDYTGVGP